ncbi:MAG: penicillin-binding protein activator [Rhodobacter sp.]|nr:penicillin-binding protein activator [Rhodobacter sp.]
MFTRKARRWAARTLVAATCLVLAACDTIPLSSAGTGPRIDTGRPVVVALLVPSGSGQASDDFLAQGLENAARLAIADLGGVQIDLKVYSTAGNSQRAADVAAQAVNDGAKIILGPLYAGSAASVGVTVAPSNINVLAFSNNTDIAGGNVYVLGNTFENTADRLVRYAVANGKNKIMIVNGQDTAEQKGRAAIAAAMARYGATSAGSTSFELSQNGIINAIPTITQTARSNGAQAVFLTSGTAAALPVLTQLLADNGLGSASTQFIGLQRWDIPANARELSSLQGGWFAMPSPGLAATYNARYTQAYGSSPPPLSELAYDGIAAVGALIASGKSNALTGAALTQSTGFAGVSGIFRLRSDGTNERGLAIAMISDKQVKVIDPAPRSFGGAGF